MLDWIFDGIVGWVSSVVTKLMDAVSGLFLGALGTDMTAMEEYFPFVSKAFTIIQFTAWTLLFLVSIWKMFRAFGGPITEAENPLTLLMRSVVFALLIGFAKPVFLYVLKIARAPYTALMDVMMGAEDFTFAGIESVLRSGLISVVSGASVVGSLLVIILMIALGWNYFKLLLEVVERYVVVGVLCYTSPLAYAMGASKDTNQVFKSWCRMVGSQLLLLVMNVWFLRAFNSSVGQYLGSEGALSNGHGSVFLWLFCALAFLKVAQRFDSYLASIGLNVAQTGAGLGMEMLVASRVIMGGLGGFRNAGNVFRGGGGGPIGMAGGLAGFAGKFTDRFKGNSYVRDAVVQGGVRMGAGGPLGFIGRAFGGLAAKNGATLTGDSIASVANRPLSQSGGIAGSIADRSLGSYLPNLKGQSLSGTQITGGKITTTATGADGKTSSLSLYNASQFEKPNSPHSVVTASDGSQWYQMASGSGASECFGTPNFTGAANEAGQVSATFPSAEEGTSIRTVGDGVLEASSSSGNSLWYSGAYFDEPEAPHTVMQDSNGVDWYAMNPNAEPPAFEAGDGAGEYNCAQFKQFMPGYEQDISSVNFSGSQEGHFEVRHDDGSGTAFYDATRYETPRGDYNTYEDARGSQWYAVHGDPAVERRPVYEDGKAVYDGENVRTVQTETVRYRATPNKFGEPHSRNNSESHAPKRK